MDILIIFARAPRIGQVKTRLASAIGPELALAAYQQMLAKTIDATKSFEQVELRHDPVDASDDFKRLALGHWTLRPQGAGDLGARLQRAFHDAFAAGASRVAVIGSDCPYITRKDITDAWGVLKTHQLALGPAVDGGYWLIGLSREAPELFENIPWSSADVLATTLARGRALGLKMDLLRILTDIDSAEDWAEYLSTQKSGPGTKGRGANK